MGIPVDKTEPELWKVGKPGTRTGEGTCYGLVNDNSFNLLSAYNVSESILWVFSPLIYSFYPMR